MFTNEPRALGRSIYLAAPLSARSLLASLHEEELAAWFQWAAVVWRGSIAGRHRVDASRGMGTRSGCLRVIGGGLSVVAWVASAGGSERAARVERARGRARDGAYSAPGPPDGSEGACKPWGRRGAPPPPQPD